MNKTYRSIYNERTGSFVAVAENVKARGKRSSSRVSAASGIASALIAGAMLTGGAQAEVVVDEPNNKISFGSGGVIEFTGAEGGTISGVKSITGLTGLTMSGELSAASLKIGGTALVVPATGNITVGRAISMGNNKITGLADGLINATSTDAVTGKQIHNILLGEDAVGVRYFHAKSEDPDSKAEGDESIAIGPGTVASGDSSFAAGDGALTRETAEGSIALGQGATVGGLDGSVVPEQPAGGIGSIAIGRDSRVDGNRSIALGDEAQVTHREITDAVAIGSDAEVFGSTSHGAVALGNGARAGAASASALGTGAAALGLKSVAVGDSHSAGEDSVAVGYGAVAATNHSIALGSNAGAGTSVETNDPGQRHSFIAIGKQAGQRMDGLEVTAIGVGAGSDIKGSQQIAIGTEAGTWLEGERNVSIGFQANHYTGQHEAIRHATAIGGLARAGTDAVAVGYGAQAASSGVALGTGAVANSSNIALGTNSFASNVSGIGFLTGRDYNGPSVSVGNADSGLLRRITNVADGSGDYDAVNVAQLKKLQEQFQQAPVTPQPGVGVVYNSDGTINAAPAITSDNVVNLAQMNAAISEKSPKFYSVNPNGDGANLNGDGALGDDSANSMAIGHAAKVENAQRATAVGYNVLVKAQDGIALGSGSTVDDAAGVAIGQGAYSRYVNSIAIGKDAQTENQGVGTSADNAVAMGTSSRATDASATAIGHQATAAGLQSSALGRLANARGNDSIAVGTDSRALETNAQASGTRALARADNAIATGTDAKAYAVNGIALGTDAVAGFASPGSDAERARNHSAMAIGVNARAVEQEAQAYGPSARASGIRAQAMGSFAEATAEDAVAIGTRAEAVGQSATALGQRAFAYAENASAVGSGARALHNGSVALGSGAETMAAVGTSNVTIDKKTYNFAGTSPVATVSVGDLGAERTVTNVAAGRISATSTDAINGSQLFRTNQSVNALASDLDTAGNSVANALGGTSSYDSDTHTVTAGLTVGGNSYTTVQQALTYVGQGWNVSAEGGAAANVAPGGAVDFSNTDGNIDIARSGTNLTFDLAEEIDLGEDGSVTTGNTVMDDTGVAVGDDVKLADTGLSVNDGAGNSTTTTVAGTTVTNVAGASTTVGAGTVSVTDGTNTTSLGATQVLVGGNNQITIDGSTGTIIGLTNKTFDPDSFTSGRAATEDQLKSVSDVANSGWNLTGSGEDEVNIGPDGSVDFVGDTNITVAQTGVADDGVIEISLNEEIDLGEDGSVTTGDTVMDNSGLTVADGTGASTSVAAGVVTVEANPTTGPANTITLDANTGTITVGDGANVATTISNTQVVVGGNSRITIDGSTGTITGLTNKTFDPDNFTSGQAATEDQLKSVSDVANAGWNLTGSGEDEVNIGPDGSVDFVGDTNISVAQTGVADDGVIEISLNKNIDLGEDGSVKIGDDAVNSLLNADGLLVKDATAETNVLPGAITLADQAEGNAIIMDAEAGAIWVGDADQVATVIRNTDVTVGGDHPILISGETGTIGGLTNTTFDPDETYTGGIAATQEQLSALNTSLTNVGLNFVGDDGQVVHRNLGQTLSIKGGANTAALSSGNIGVTQDGSGGLTVELARNIDLGPDGSMAIGDTLIDNDGLSVEDDDGNVTTTAATGTTVVNAAGDTTTVGAGTITVVDGSTGYTTQVTGNQVAVGGANPITVSGDSGTIGGLTNKTFDPDNFTSGQAATEDQLKLVSDVANAGWNVTDAEGNTANIGPEGQVAFIGDDNITVTQTGTDDDGVVEVALNDTIVLGDGENAVTINGDNGSISVGDTVVNAGGVNVGSDVQLGNTGLTIVGGPSVTQVGIDAGGLRITNVAAGVNPTDAVNYGQLQPMESFIDLDGNGTFAYNGSQHASLKDVLDSLHWNVEAPAPDNSGGTGGSGGSDGGTGGTDGGTGGGTGGGGTGGSTTPIHNGNTVGFVQGDNIVISKTNRPNGEGADITIAVAQDLNVNSITAVKVQADRVEISNGGPVIDENGIDMSGKRITNVVAGVNETDAVNVGQLNQVAGNLQGQVNNLRQDLRRQEKRMSAGVAAAMATASLPQAYLPGKHMMAMAAGTWNGESGMAMGFSGITDNGKWVYKLSGNATSRGDYGGAVGVGYQW